MVNQLNQSEYVRMITSEGRYHPPSFSRPVNEQMNPMGGIFVVVLHGGHDFFRVRRGSLSQQPFSNSQGAG